MQSGHPPESHPFQMTYCSCVSCQWLTCALSAVPIIIHELVHTSPLTTSGGRIQIICHTNNSARVARDKIACQGKIANLKRYLLSVCSSTISREMFVANLHCNTLVSESDKVEKMCNIFQLRPAIVKFVIANLYPKLATSPRRPSALWLHTTRARRVHYLSLARVV